MSPFLLGVFSDSMSDGRLARLALLRHTPCCLHLIAGAGGIRRSYRVKGATMAFAGECSSPCPALSLRGGRSGESTGIKP